MKKTELVVDLFHGSPDMESLAKDMYKYVKNQDKMNQMIRKMDKLGFEQKDLLERFEGLIPQFSTIFKK